MEKYLEELKEIWMEKLVFFKLKFILNIYCNTQTLDRSWLRKTQGHQGSTKTGI